MIDKKSRRVVIINNIQSDSIDQAIFILKSNKNDLSNSKKDSNIAQEAQRIIDNYIHQVEATKSAARSSFPFDSTKKRRLPTWLKILLGATALAALVFFIT